MPEVSEVTSGRSGRPSRGRPSRREVAQLAVAWAAAHRSVGARRGPQGAEVPQGCMSRAETFLLGLLALCAWLTAGGLIWGWL